MSDREPPHVPGRPPAPPKPQPWWLTWLLVVIGVVIGIPVLWFLGCLVLIARDLSRT